MKLNLSMLVVSSSLVGYVIVPELKVEFWPLLLLFLGGLLVTSAANASNEILEVDTDKIMKRTQIRPLPAARMNRTEAIIFSILTLCIGLAILYTFNLKSALLALFCYVLYVFVYTQMYMP